MTMRYGTIIADPPWRYGGRGNEGAAADLYPVLAVEDLCRMPIRAMAADDAMLLLWATWPRLADAMRVIEAWGFGYLTGLPWVKIVGEPRRNLWGDLDIKPQYGIGYWVRTCSELVLIARRGNVSPPEGSSLGLLSENFGHSRKPDNLYEYAEHLAGPYLELFARRTRPGWDQYGNEIDGAITLAEVPA